MYYAMCVAVDTTSQEKPRVLLALPRLAPRAFAERLLSQAIRSRTHTRTVVNIQVFCYWGCTCFIPVTDLRASVTCSVAEKKR